MVYDVLGKQKYKLHLILTMRIKKKANIYIAWLSDILRECFLDTAKIKKKKKKGGAVVHPAYCNKQVNPLLEMD